MEQRRKSKKNRNGKSTTRQLYESQKVFGFAIAIAFWYWRLRNNFQFEFCHKFVFDACLWAYFCFDIAKWVLIKNIANESNARASTQLRVTVNLHSQAGECGCECEVCAASAQPMQFHSIFVSFFFLFSSKREWCIERKTVRKINKKKRSSKRNKNNKFGEKHCLFVFYEHRQQHPRFTNDTVTNNKLNDFFFN